MSPSTCSRLLLLLFNPFLLLMLSCFVVTVQGCPSLFCSCSHQNVVDCSGKNLQVLPDGIPINVVKLYLDNNDFTSIPDVSRFTNLEELTLSNNAIASVDISITSKFNNLKILDLSGNQLKILPHGMFSATNQLEQLDASRNNLTDISALSASLLMLKNLNIQHNQLKNLDVIRNNNKFVALNILRAGYNLIQSLATSLDQMGNTFPALQFFELNNNNISSIRYWLKRCQALKKLVLSYNDLHTLDGTSFLHNDNLEELYLDHNKLSSVSKIWLTFKSRLQTLDLSYNSIEEIEHGAFQSAENVKYIDLSHNKLKSLHYGLLYHLHDLSYLNLHGNSIHYVSAHAFIGLQNLVYLNLSRNEISLGDKEFETAFKSFLTLEILDMNNNNILLIPTRSFDGLSTLKTLYLRENAIEVIEEDAFIHLSSVRSLYFESNHLLCDCSIKSLRNWLMVKSFLTNPMVTGICAAPPWMKEKNIRNVIDSELKCDFPTGHDSKHSNRPMVVTNPQSKYAFLHGNVTLYCMATSSRDSPIHIQWYHGTQELQKGTTKLSAQVLIASHLYKRNSTLTVAQLSYIDGGKYWCHVSNVYGSDWSAQANVTIATAPKLSPELQKSITARSGHTIYIPCSAEGAPTPSIRFNKVGLPFPAVGEKRIVYTDQKFGIERLKIEDSGVYTCTATNPVGKANTTIILSVIEKPKFVRIMRGKSVKLGSPAVIDCIVSGNPTPQITWYKDNTLVKPSKRIKLSNQLLVISSFDYEDVASYTCEASNSLGDTRQTARITLDLTKDHSTTELSSDIFITVIVLTVIAVTVLTSLVWIAFICFCRKRRREEKEKQRTNLISMCTEESLLPELPRDYVLKCNGQLVSAPAKVSSISLDPLIEEARDYLRQQQQGFTDSDLSRKLSEDSGDDSGIALSYLPSLDEQTIDKTIQTPSMCHKKPDSRTSSNSSIKEKRKNENLRTSNNNLHNGSLAMQELKGSSLPFSSKKQNLPSKQKLVEFDPTRLKLITQSSSSSTSSSSSSSNRPSPSYLKYADVFKTDRKPSDEMYQAYMTSSSGVESGGSSSAENVSLGNADSTTLII